VKNPDLFECSYVTNLVAPGTVDTVPEKTLLASVDHGSWDALFELDAETAEVHVAAAVTGGVDADELAHSLQRQGGRVDSNDWAGLADAIGVRVAEMQEDGLLAPTA